MPNTFTTVIAGIFLILSIELTALAESPHQRTALMLSGTDCPTFRRNLTAALQQHAGVLHVDMDLVPDHVLIDHIGQELTEDDLAAIANAAIPQDAKCHIDVMKSCITADMAPHAPAGQLNVSGYPKTGPVGDKSADAISEALPATH